MDHLHFNKDHPENHNVYVASIKDGHVVTFDGENWKIGINDEVMNNLIQRKADILEEKYEELVDILSPMETKKFNNFINRKDDNRVMVKLKRELRVQLYNNRHFGKLSRKYVERKLKDTRKFDKSILKNETDDKEKFMESLNNKSVEELRELLYRQSKK